MKTLARTATQPQIYDGLKSLYPKLDQINALSGNGLLETHERDIFVTFTIDSAEAAGLDLLEFEDRDPTLGFRNF